MQKGSKTTVYLDKEAAGVVRDFLQKNGQSLSGWFNALLIEFAEEIKGQPSPLNKPIEEMTLKEFGEVASYWWRKAIGEKSEDQEVKPSGP